MRRMCAIVLAILALAALSLPAQAMTFHVSKTSAGLRVVVATGDIVRGDAQKLARALQRATRDKNGTIELLLDSPGGLVAEALMMADVMDDTGVTTVVARGAICASACASVLFVSGKYRRVDKGGILAIHSCYDSRNGVAARDCNAAISAHADFEGVSGVAMMALQEAAGAEGAFVFDKEGAACFGLTLQPGAKPSRKVPPCLAAALKAARKK